MKHTHFSASTGILIKTNVTSTGTHKVKENLRLCLSTSTQACQGCASVKLFLCAYVVQTVASIEKRSTYLFPKRKCRKEKHYCLHRSNFRQRFMYLSTACLMTITSQSVFKYTESVRW